MLLNKFFPFLLLLIFGILSSVDLLQRGMPPTHDGEYHVIRFYQFYKVFSEGVLYPRWAPDLNNGFGVPLFNYVYPLPNYIAAFMHVLGISFIDSFKLQLFIASIISGMFFYLWAKEYWGVLGGIFSATVYLFSPYRLVDIFVRGSIGEVWALTFFPGFLWTFYMFYKKKSYSFFVSSCVFLSLVIYSHNIVGLMFFSFGFLYAIFLVSQSKNIKNELIRVFKVFFFSLLLSGAFWIPALIEKSYVKGLQIYEVKENFPDLYQLLIPSWGTGFSGGTLQDQMSFQIGLVNIIAVIISLVIFPFMKRKNSNIVKTLGFFNCMFFGVSFLILPYSEPIWDWIPLLQYFQFPWRFLSLIIIITSFLAGSIFFSFRSKIALCVFCTITILLTIGYAKFAYFHDRTDSYYLNRNNFINGTNSVGDMFNTIWLDTIPKSKKEKIVPSHQLKIEAREITSLRYNYLLISKKAQSIYINTAYFPGWRVIINNKQIKMSESNGIIKIPIPKGKVELEIALKNTLVQSFSVMVTIFGVFLLFYNKLIYRNEN